MQKPKITLNRSEINALAAANSPQHAHYASTPATILFSLDEDLKRAANGESVDLLQSFIGNFNQFAKWETGTPERQAQVDNLPSCFLNLSNAITKNNPAAVGSFVVQPCGGWGELIHFCQSKKMEIQVAEVKQALQDWERIVHGHPPNMRDRADLGRKLIQGLLIPILCKM